MPMKKPQVNKIIPHILSLKMGDVVAIPLRDGRFAYGHIFRRATFGIFRCLSSDLAPLEYLNESEKIA